MGDTSGDYRNLLRTLLSMGRNESTQVDLNQVRRDADALAKAGVSQWGTDEAAFNSVIGLRSFAHLRKVFDAYEAQTKSTIEADIKKEMSSNLARTYQALIANIRNRPGYFAKEIKRAVKGLGTDEHTLNRIFVSRCEVDMKQIKVYYCSIRFCTVMSFSKHETRRLIIIMMTRAFPRLNFFPCLLEFWQKISVFEIESSSLCYTKLQIRISSFLYKNLNLYIFT